MILGSRTTRQLARGAEHWYTMFGQANLFSVRPLIRLFLIIFCAASAFFFFFISNRIQLCLFRARLVQVIIVYIYASEHDTMWTRPKKKLLLIFAADKMSVNAYS